MSKENAPGVEDGEWELQEDNVRRPRGNAAFEPGTSAESYRRVGVALDCMPRAEPPPDFASQVVKQVDRQAPGLDRALYRSLALLLPTLSVLLIWLHGGHWWSTTQGALATEMAWPAICAVCVALSWLTTQLRDLRAWKSVDPRH